MDADLKVKQNLEKSNYGLAPAGSTLQGSVFVYIIKTQMQKYHQESIGGVLKLFADGFEVYIVSSSSSSSSVAV